VDKKPKKKRKKKSPIEIDQERLREYKEDIESGAFDNYEIRLEKRGPFPDHPDPKTYLPYLKQGFEDDFPSAFWRAVRYCLTSKEPWDGWMITKMLEIADREIERNPGNIKGGHPVEVDDSLRLFFDVEIWREERKRATKDGKSRHFTVDEAVKLVWHARNPRLNSTYLDKHPNALKSLKEAYYVVRKRYFAKHYKDRLLP
jgi:hypothetical protein